MPQPSGSTPTLVSLSEALPLPRWRLDVRRLAIDALPVGCASTAAAFYAVVSIHRHDRFASGGYDLGIFDQTIWGYSRFAIVRNTVKGVPNLLGDHFHPALMLLAPAYWVWDDARVLLVAQALLLAAASLPLFWWARPRLGLAGATAIQLAFLGFWGLLAGMIFDFHELALAVPAISFGLYALLERRQALFWLMLALGCLAKEDIALTFAAMGLYAVVVQRRARFGLGVIGLAGAWFVVALGAIIPAISGHRYHYWDYPSLGRSWTRAPLAAVRRPWRVAAAVVDKGEKRATLAATFGAWLFLPLASPLLIVALPTIAERFLAGNPAFWSDRFQYSLPIAPILAFAAVDTLSRMKRLRSLAVVGVLATGLVLTVGVVRPLHGLSGYMTAARAGEIDACLDRIPRRASVAASGPLVPHLSHRLQIDPLFRQDHDAYLAVEGRAGRDPGYRRVCRDGGVTILHRS
ncbi:MAG TPA: DUF2079 domain-containing protein [Gaiellaceae bacterium]|nr:DUF2079 domain-containing protein [Gaiellaceae bacterium]